MKIFRAEKFFLFLIACVLFLPVASYAGEAGKRVAVLPWKVNAPQDMQFVGNAINDMLLSRIGKGESVDLLTKEVSDALSKKTPSLTDESVEQIGKAIKADFVVYGSLNILGNSVSLDAKVLDVNKKSVTPFSSSSTGLDSIVSLVEGLSKEVLSKASFGPSKESSPAYTGKFAPVAKAPEPVKEEAAKPSAAKKADEQFFVKKEETRPMESVWRSKDFYGFHFGLVAADLDRDNEKELFILSAKKLVISRAKPAGLEVVQEITNNDSSVNVSLAVADADNDGAPELYVSRMYKEKPYSSIIEHTEGKYKESASKISWLFRTVTVNGKETLLGQRFKANSYYGKIKILSKKGSELIEEGDFTQELPDKTNFYNFEVLKDPAGSGNTIASLDDRNYLKLYRTGDNGLSEAWKSAGFYGGTLNVIEPEGSPVYHPVESRIVEADLDKDGTPELVIKKNVPGGFGRASARPWSFKSGQIVGLKWDGAMYGESWQSKEISGYISDFIVDDLNADGSREVIMLVTEGEGGLSKGSKSYILSYEIGI